MYKLIAVDLDGTLLNSDKLISERNKASLFKTRQSGIEVVICSGRFINTVITYSKECGGKYVIACNGALTYDLSASRVLRHVAIRSSDILKVIELLDHSEISYNIFDRDKLIIRSKSIESNYYVMNNPKVPKHLRVDYTIVNDLKAVLDMIEATKIEIYSTNLDHLKKVRMLINSVDGINTTSSGADSFDVVSSGVSKGSALEILVSSLNICRDDVIAIGDNENDNTMIQYASLGIAMGNGTMGIKKIADFITDTNDNDGVAKAIDRFINR